MTPQDRARSHGRLRSLPKASVSRFEGPGALDALSAVLPPLLYVDSTRQQWFLDVRGDPRRQGVLGWRGPPMLPLEEHVPREHTPSYGAA